MVATVEVSNDSRRIQGVQGRAVTGWDEGRML